MNHIPQPRTRVSVCTFKRNKTSAWERGVMLGHGDIILDLNKKVVKEVWTYGVLAEEGCFTVAPMNPPPPSPTPKPEPRHSLRA